MNKIASTSILLFMVVVVQAFAQFETIQEFPKTYLNQDIRELTPVWISENEILTFYTTGTLDTIFSRRSTDQGQSWSEQKVEQFYTWSSPPYWADKLFIAAIKAHNNRLILSWKGKIVYSCMDSSPFASPRHVQKGSTAHVYPVSWSCSNARDHNGLSARQLPSGNASS